MTVSSHGARRLAIAAALLLGAGVGAAGCGSSSSSGAFDEFIGTWILAPDTPARMSMASLVCPAVGFNGDPGVFQTIDFEPGTLSDLLDIAAPGSCRFAFDVVGKTATLASPDPFTGTAPTCAIDLGPIMVSTTVTVDEKFEITPTPGSWKFNLVAPVKGQPPQGQLLATATTTFNDYDPMTNALVMPNPCTSFTLVLNYNKIAKN